MFLRDESVDEYQGYGARREIAQTEYYAADYGAWSRGELLVDEAALEHPAREYRYQHAAKGHDGVIPVLPMKDTVYASTDRHTITSLLDRGSIFAGQAPELFRVGSYYEAVMRLVPEQILSINGSTEPAVMAGLDIVMIPGDEANFKITTKEDLENFRRMVKGT